MELGRSARPTMMMSASPGRGGGDGATYGVDRSTMANSQALTWCAWLRSRRARLRKISGIWQRYSYSLPSRARERLGGAMPTDLLDLLGPPGWCSGCWPHDGEVAGGAVASSF